MSPPFVMAKDGKFSGMAIELWEEIASTLNLQSEYSVLPTLSDLTSATAQGKVDVAVTNLTVTQERARRIDFTHPWFDAGLRIMIHRERHADFQDLIAGLERSGHLRAYVWLLSVIVVATLLLTLFDRRFDVHFPKRWREGLAESFYTVMSIATSGKADRKNLFGWLGRLAAACWLICGVALIAYVTSSVTSVMTEIALSRAINGLADLPGKTVGVFTGSVAERFAATSAFSSQSFDNIDAAVDALSDGRIDAIVGDAPVLEYYSHARAEIPVAVVGPIFQPDKYGFAFPLGSELTRHVTVELLGAHERQRVAQLRAKYFGATH